MFLVIYVHGTMQVFFSYLHVFLLLLSFLSLIFFGFFTDAVIFFIAVIKKCVFNGTERNTE